MEKKIVISPQFDPFYCGYYYEGLRSIYCEKSIYFSLNEIPLELRNECIALVNLHRNTRIYIDARDSSEIDECAFQWCDKYAKVNLSEENILLRGKDKFLAIGPNFGIRIWHLIKAVKISILNYMKTSQNLTRTYWDYFGNYYRQYKYRLPLQAYSCQPSDSTFIFYASSLWKNELETNHYRANFIRACKSMNNINFMGGFAQRRLKDVEGFEDITFGNRFSLSDYINQTKRSAVVFSTPAVFGCHGWKLGEFLALGKAIISTPLTRLLPSPLEHGEHIHFVNGLYEEISDAVDKIINDNNYRRKLECNARKYFNDYLAPNKVIERILKS